MIWSATNARGLLMRSVIFSECACRWQTRGQFLTFDVSLLLLESENRTRGLSSTTPRVVSINSIVARSVLGRISEQTGVFGFAHFSDGPHVETLGTFHAQYVGRKPAIGRKKNAHACHSF